jgi:hypothetical protein
VISYQVVQEFFSVAFRRFTPRMRFAEAEQYLAATFQPLLAVFRGTTASSWPPRVRANAASCSAKIFRMGNLSAG